MLAAQRKMTGSTQIVSEPTTAASPSERQLLSIVANSLVRMCVNYLNRRTIFSFIDLVYVARELQK